MTVAKLQKNQYKGCIHIHSILSDGTGDIEAISKAAKKAGLSWIIITDHNHFDMNEGIYNGVYVIKGEEVSPATENHYIALGINKQIEPKDNPQAYIDEVRNQGGIGFAAHPDENKNRKNNNPPIVWNKSFEPDGVEIWNWFSSWGDRLNDRNIFKLAFAYLFRHKMIKNPAFDTLKWWDSLNKNSSKIIPAIGGVDAHALKINKYFFPVTIFPYKTCFKTITNVIALNEPLSGDFNAAKGQILSAIKQGNNIIINRKICDDVPEISISNSDNEKASDDVVRLAGETYLNIQTKEKSDIRVILDGKEYSNNRAKKISIPITKAGKYRVEFSYSNRGYAYTNPIQVVNE